MDRTQAGAPVTGQEHWTKKGDVRLFLWEKFCGRPDAAKGRFLFVHGSSMASTPTFDPQVPGRPHSWRESRTRAGSKLQR